MQPEERRSPQFMSTVKELNELNDLEEDAVKVSLLLLVIFSDM